MPVHFCCCLLNLRCASGVQVFTRSQAACGRQRSWTMLSPSWAMAPVIKGKTTGSSSGFAVVHGISVHANNRIYLPFAINDSLQLKAMIIKRAAI